MFDDAKAETPPHADSEDGSMTDSGAKDHGENRMEEMRLLLFGSQMREYDRRFNELAQRITLEINRLRDEQRAHADKLEAFIRGEFDRLTSDLRQEREERVVGQQQCTDQIEQSNRDLSARAEALKGALADEVRQREAALLTQSRELLEALHSRASALEGTLQQERDRLQDEKTSRGELAQLFSEVALRLNRDLNLPEV